MADNLTKCACGCNYVPDHGACPTFEPHCGELCVYCNHGEACHIRDANKPIYNTPLGIGFRDERLAKIHEGLDVS